MRRNVGLFCTRHPRRDCFIVLVAAVFVFGGGALLINGRSVRWIDGNTLEENIAILETRLKFIESQFGGKKEEIYNMQARVEGGYDEKQQVSESEVANTTYSPELQALLRNISGSQASGALSKAPEHIKAPFSMRIMPHLLDDKNSLRPAYQLRMKKNYADYIIGIPHVKRDKETYLFVTLEALVQNMTEDDKNASIIVVMIGETDLVYVVETAHKIEKQFSDEIYSGLIQVISPTAQYYPDLDAVQPNLGDSQKRVRWRTKQNLDAIFLMSYAESRCLYYLMIEDDVIAAHSFMSQIRKFTAATTVSNPGWFFIQYSTTGGIGKLFRSSDLIHFINYVTLFWNKMPIDWLTESYLADRTCGINKGAKECADAKTKIRPTYKTNLFKHIGLYSSLKGKIQKVKDVPKEKVKNFFPHDNPPVSKIKNDLGTHGDYTIENAYNGEKFFWGLHPKAGDVIEFWFKEPQNITKYLIRSSNVDHAADKIYKASIDVLPDKPDAAFTKIDDFDEFGMVEGYLTGHTYGELQAIRINFKEASKFWVVITEIEFVPFKEEAVI